MIRLESKIDILMTQSAAQNNSLHSAFVLVQDSMTEVERTRALVQELQQDSMKEVERLRHDVEGLRGLLDKVWKLLQVKQVL